ncbi:signal peptide-containing secreted protein, partial [Cryptosporidium canis]
MRWLHLLIVIFIQLSWVFGADNSGTKHRISVFFQDNGSEVRLSGSPKTTLGQALVSFFQSNTAGEKGLSSYNYVLKSTGSEVSTDASISTIASDDTVIAIPNKSEASGGDDMSEIDLGGEAQVRSGQGTQQKYVELAPDDVHLRVTMPDGIVENVVVNKKFTISRLRDKIMSEFGISGRYDISDGERALPRSSTVEELGLEDMDSPLFLTVGGSSAKGSGRDSERRQVVTGDSSSLGEGDPYGFGAVGGSSPAAFQGQAGGRLGGGIPGDYILKTVKIKLYFLAKRVNVAYSTLYSRTASDLIYDINIQKNIPVNMIRLGIMREGNPHPMSVGIDSPEAELSLYELGLRNGDVVIVAGPETNFARTELPFRKGSRFKIYLSCQDAPHSQKRFSVEVWENTSIDSIRIALSGPLRVPFSDIDLEIEDIDINGQVVMWRRLRGYNLGQLNILADTELFVRTGPYKYVTLQPSYFNKLTGKHEVPMDVRIRFDDFSGFDLLLGVYPSTTIKQLKRLIAWRRSYIPSSINLEIIGIDRRMMPTSIIPSNDLLTLRKLRIIPGIIFRVKLSGSPIEPSTIPVEDIHDKEYVDGSQKVNDGGKPTITLNIMIVNRDLAPVQIVCFPTTKIRSIIASISKRRNISQGTIRLYSEKQLENGALYRRYYEKLPEKTVEESKITRGMDLFVEVMEEVKKDDTGNIVRDGMVNLIVKWDDGTTSNIPVPLSSKLSQFRGTLAGLKGTSPESVTLSRKLGDGDQAHKMINVDASIDSYKLKDGDMIEVAIDSSGEVDSSASGGESSPDNSSQRLTGLRFSWPDGTTVVTSGRGSKKLGEIKTFLAERRGNDPKTVAIYFSSGRKLVGDDKTLFELGIQSDMQFWVETDALHWENPNDPVRFVIRNTDTLWSTVVFISPDAYVTATVKDLIDEYKSKSMIPREANVQIIGFEGIQETDLLSKYEDDERIRHLLVEVKLPNDSGLAGAITGEPENPTQPIDKLKQIINWDGPVKFTPTQKRGPFSAKADTTEIQVMMPVAAFIRPRLVVDEALLQAFGDIADSELNERVFGPAGKKISSKNKENLVAKMASTRRAAYVLHVICSLNNLSTDKFMMITHTKPPFEARKCTKHLALGLDKYYRYARGILGKRPIRYKKAIKALRNAKKEFTKAYSYVVKNSSKMARIIKRKSKKSGNIPDQDFLNALALSGKMKYERKQQVDVNMQNLYAVLRPVATQQDIDESLKRERETSRILHGG